VHEALAAHGLVATDGDAGRLADLQIQEPGCEMGAPSEYPGSSA